MLRKLLDFLEGGKSTASHGQVQSRAQNATPHWSLDTPLMNWMTVIDGRSHSIPFTLREACEGLQVFGATGSGKTSGTANAIARAYLRAGFGGLVLCAKPDESEKWVKLANEEGRLSDLVLFGPDGAQKFNFLHYEMNRPGRGSHQTESVVSVLMQAAEIAARQKDNEQDVWERAMQQLLRNGIDLLRLADQPITLSELYRFGLDHEHVTLRLADAQKRLSSLNEIDKGDFEVVQRYWIKEWMTMAERTRSSVQMTFGALVDPFLRGTIRNLFCTETTITPEAAHDGKIIVVDLPIKEFADAGRYAAVIWKFLFQRAAERRRVAEETRPLFIFSDESQYFLTSTDPEFQSTARSSKTSTVYLTQNLPHYYQQGGKMGHHGVDSFLGNMQTFVFHQNACSTTNRWAAERISKILQHRQSTNQGSQFSISNGAGGSAGDSTQEVMDYDIQPRRFMELAKGGPTHNMVVTALLFKCGAILPNGKTTIEIAFQQ